MKGSTSSGFFITVLLIAILLTALSLIAVLEAFSNSQRKETIVLSSIELIKTS
ncbi:MAG: hypothetical protein HY518_00360, partial [Candidatus Aenigmarchaeota archaeon]|nr:hypothetical protein [Candidatus Aenigmarchaeota archaeon]